MQKRLNSRNILMLCALIPFMLIVAYLARWYQYKPLRNLPPELATMTVENHGLTENLILYFDASANGVDGRPFERGNYLLTLATNTGAISAERVPGKGQQHEIQWNGYTSHYAITPLNSLGQQYQMAFAGIPIATGGHYVIRDESGKAIAAVKDAYGMDLHDFIITPEGNYLYLAAHRLSVYRDPTLTCLPQCGLLGQSVVEITPEGKEVYRYHLLDHYTRDDFVMDDMLIQEDWNLYDVTHANSIRLTPDGTTLIISVRHTNEVLALDRSTGNLVWRSSDYTFVDDPYNGFSHQHDAQILDNGNLLLFDNGNERGMDSRAVEYEIDHDARTMTRVWSYTDWQFTPNRGSVRITAGGNYLINFVNRDQDDIVIVSPAGDLLYSITIPEPYASYRASVQTQ